MFDIIGKRFLWFLISGIVTLASIVALIVFGFKPSVEFSSGTLLTVKFDESFTSQQVNQAVIDLGYTDTIIQSTGEGTFLIRLPEIDATQKQSIGNGLTEKLGTFTEQGFDAVSPMVASETTRNAIIAVIISAVGMLLYITWAFHRVPNPFRWGTCAIIALAHDILVVLGVFSILSHFLNWQIDLMFVTGMLTVVGYSINDTIVVFDRIRENLLRSGRTNFEKLVNNSLLETIGRTLITGMGTIFVLVALLLFVGEPIQNLAWTLLIGVITGTYSCMFISASLLVVWDKGEWGRFIGRKSQT